MAQLMEGASVPFLGDDELLVSFFPRCVLPGAGEGCIKQGAAATGGGHLGEPFAVAWLMGRRNCAELGYGVPVRGCG